MPTPVLLVGIKSLLGIEMLLMFNTGGIYYYSGVRISVMRPESRERESEVYFPNNGLQLMSINKRSLIQK